MILFESTRGKSEKIIFEDAARKGLAPDGGLYLPDRIPELPQEFITSLKDRPLDEIGFEVASAFINSEVSASRLKSVLNEAISFEAPLIRLSEEIYILELFHGPTLAFKDYGARFMARLLSAMEGPREKDLVVLVATSGDTGSAVAHGFYDVRGTHVCLLYPKGKVSRIQEKQMSTLGKNVTALEVNGVFDDCQKLVKAVLSDDDLNSQLRLSSANSINIARLLPQMFYYFSAAGQLAAITGNSPKPVFSVPSGNFGNLTAGIMAMKMGLPVSRFLAATNINNVVPQYLETGTYKPRPSEATISNAMDVGRPSNFERIWKLFEGSHQEMKKWICGSSASDFETMECIRRVYDRDGYIADPHTAVGILALENYRQETGSTDPAIVLSTAHPAKFSDVVEKVTGITLETPERLAACLDRNKQTREINADYPELKEFLMIRYGM